MAKADLLFLNNKAMEACGVLDMQEAIKDVEATYILTEKGDVILPGKLVTRWGTTPEDENRLGRINAMPGYIGGDYNMAGIKWIGSGPQNYKRGLPRASVTVILNDPDTKLPVCIADGTAYTFVENFANEPREVDLGAAPRKDLLSGWTLSGKVPLQPYGVLALRG